MEKENPPIQIPEFLYNMLYAQYGENITNQIIEGYIQKRKVTFRVNTLKSDVQTIKEKLNQKGT